MKRSATKKRKGDLREQYRQILNMPELTDHEVREIRKNLRLLAQAICEHVWKKKFY
jgi:hypothetical protein